MADLPKEILAEKENVENALKNLQEAVTRPEQTVVELSAIAVFLHNIYNGIENILKQTLKTKDIQIPKSETWHKDMLNLSVEVGIISKDLSDELYEYLTFRHFFIHAYGFMIEEPLLENLVVNIPRIWAVFIDEVKKFFKFL